MTRTGFWVGAIACVAGFSTSAVACELTSSGRYMRIAMLGQFAVEEVGPGQITFARSAGDLADPAPHNVDPRKFSKNTLVEMRSAAGRGWRFRAEGNFFDRGARRTALYGVRWAFPAPKLPDRGTYAFWSVAEREEVSALPTLTMVGDSITWMRYGQSFRCRLAESLPVRFTGARTDVYGFHHEGEGGDATGDVLARLDRIAPADAYFLLLGTNDASGGDVAGALGRLKTIAERLEKRSSVVMVSTILPRADDLSGFAQSLNAGIREWLRAEDGRIRLIDLAAEFSRLDDWHGLLLFDGLHPNESGYDAITRILAPQIRQVLDGAKRK